jgi:hypothetical protein
VKVHAGAVEAALANGATAIATAPAAASSSGGTNARILGMASRAAGGVMVISLSFRVTNSSVELLAAQAMCPQSRWLACAHKPHNRRFSSFCALCSETDMGALEFDTPDKPVGQFLARIPCPGIF